MSASNHYKNILIVRTDRIGDVLLTTPAIAALREKHLDAKISILVTPQTRDIVDGNPYLDEVLIDDRKGAHRGFLGFLKLVWCLRKKRFDLAVIYHTKKRTNLLCFLAGIPNRAGYHNNKFGFLLTHKIKDTRPQGNKHEAEYCLGVLEAIGLDIPRRPDTLRLTMPLKKESDEWVEGILRDNDILPSEQLIAVHPGASCISKRWSAANFAEVINRLAEDHSTRIFLIGGHENQEITRTIKDRLEAKNSVIDLTAQTTISQLASLFKRCQLLISNDSGPVHVAVAVETPVISIFGRNQAGLSPFRWRPLGGKDIVLHKEVGCEICLAHNCIIDFECLKAIGVDEVLRAVKPLLDAGVSPRS